jgi:glycosyltransferase involved in cell wall biosynthesis
MGEIVFDVEEPPARFEVGDGNVLPIRGWALCRDQRPIRELSLSLGDRRSRHRFRGELRLDLVGDAAIRGSDGLRAMSGFWVTAPVARSQAGKRLRLTLTAHAGPHEQILIDRPIDLLPRREAGPPAGRRVAIALATYRPDLALLERQIDSLVAQSFTDWTCLVGDDGSPPETFAAIRALCARDGRFTVRRNERNRGFYRNFEDTLAALPGDAELIALCDQDDYWYEDKLLEMIGRFSDAGVQLVYCDMRLVDPHGRVLAPTYWRTRRNNFVHFDTLLVANTVTGAASMLRREVLERALPFPEPVGTPFHDHWLALVAMAAGRLDYIDRPLYDYTQHGGNVIGHAAFPTAFEQWKSFVVRIERALGSGAGIRRELGKELELYYQDYRRLSLQAEVLAMRFPSLRPEKAMALDLFSDRTADAVGLALLSTGRTLLRGDTTGFAELRLGSALLLERCLRRLVAPVLRRYRRARGARDSLRNDG